MHPIAIHTTVSKKSKHHSKWSATATYIMSPDHPRAPSTATIALHLNPIKKETSSINPQPSFSKTKVTDFISINSRKLPSPRPLPINARTSHRVFKREWKWRHSRIRTSLSGATIHTLTCAWRVTYVWPSPRSVYYCDSTSAAFSFGSEPTARWVGFEMNAQRCWWWWFFFFCDNRACLRYRRLYLYDLRKKRVFYYYGYVQTVTAQIFRLMNWLISSWRHLSEKKRFILVGL